MKSILPIHQNQFHIKFWEGEKFLNFLNVRYQNIHAQAGGRQGGGENFFANLGGGDGFFDPKGGVKRTLLRGELKIVQQRGAKSPPGRTLNRGVQMKKNFVRGGQKNFSYGVLRSCACMYQNLIFECLRTGRYLYRWGLLINMKCSRYDSNVPHIPRFLTVVRSKCGVLRWQNFNC